MVPYRGQYREFRYTVSASVEQQQVRAGHVATLRRVISSPRQLPLSMSGPCYCSACSCRWSPARILPRRGLSDRSANAFFGILKWIKCRAKDKGLRPWEASWVVSPPNRCGNVYVLLLMTLADLSKKILWLIFAIFQRSWQVRIGRNFRTTVVNKTVFLAITAFPKL